MTDFAALLRMLVSERVQFIVVGGAAAVAHGSARLTADLDIVYQRTPDNINRLVNALAAVTPYLRGAPPGLPFRWDEETLKRGLNFTLITTVGDIDLLGEITGGGRFEDLERHTVVLDIFGFRCHCLDIERLIHVKRAAGRPKDFEAIAELEAILDEQGREPD
jgi:hypothetical protein